MIDLTPRKLHLLDSYEDGRDARHFSFRIDFPQAHDLATMPGQFFMLAVPGVGEAPFTYVSPPNLYGHFNALIRRMGNLTDALFALRPGDTLGYRGPFGKGWPLFFSPRRVLVVAGGCGLAPLAGLIDEASREHLSSRLSVVYGARRDEDQILARERLRWKLAIPFIETLDDAAAGQRRGTPLDHFDEVFATVQPDTLLCCGPESLMLGAARASVEHGIQPSRIWVSLERRMHCGVGLCGHCYIGASYACLDGPTYRYDRFLALTGATDSCAAPALQRC
ncbi:FAD/NAD(P)-binding protein [Pseudomonas indica]|uniref:NAD(P)H-flavin reductase n=1 Tax=Pseudomonas indica TaxID=137658 RepID=A0A1G9BVV7_9PSED|nr:FAD/NAD(P)-binding protein [Pseudomonas indica]SDK43582.1 NAD(P)H-flavin reductase [Pseudomonas indica]